MNRDWKAKYSQGQRRRTDVVDSGCKAIRKNCQGLGLKNWLHENMTKDQMFLRLPSSKSFIYMDTLTLSGFDAGPKAVDPRFDSRKW